MYMKKLFLLKLTLCILAFSLAALPPAYAQKGKIKALQAAKSTPAGISKAAAATSQQIQRTLAAEINAATQLPKAAKAAKAAQENISRRRPDTERRIEQSVRSQHPYYSADRAKRYYPPAQRLPFDPVERIELILKNHPNPVRALAVVWDLEDSFQGRRFFSLLASTYYKQNFPVLTPHLRELFKKVESLHSRDLERRVMKRMAFLVENKDNFRASFAPDTPKQGLRMRYIKNIGKLTPNNFNPYWLAFSFERKLNPGQRNAAIRHVNARSVFPVGKNKEYPIFRYNGPFEYLPNMYRYLLNGKHPKNKLTVLFDKDARAMAIYNEDKTVWLRITMHEYSFPERLHIHLNETMTAHITTQGGRQVEETVHFNLSIPLSTPANLPARHRAEFLYNEMVIKPLQQLKGNDHIVVKETSIF